MERLPKRNEVPVELTWRLSDIYPSTDAWEKDFKESLDLAEKIAGFEGRAAADAKPDSKGARLRTRRACLP